MSAPTAAARCLIVNGDDFGLSPQVNAGILQAHRHGILTNTSLMVAAPAWREAVGSAREQPTLGVGLHLTLVQGRAVLPGRNLSTITDADGWFPNNATRAGLRYFFSSRARAEVRAECRAQLERFLATGLPLSHVDGHLNLHMHPVVMDAVLELAAEYAVPAVRLTREDTAAGLALAPRRALAKRWEGWVFGKLAARSVSALDRAGVRHPDHLFGLHQSGHVDEAYLLGLLPRLRPGVTELYCHPAVLPCPEVERWTPAYRRDLELAALTSPAVAAAVHNNDIQLVSYIDLPDIHGAAH